MRLDVVRFVLRHAELDLLHDGQARGRSRLGGGGGVRRRGGEVAGVGDDGHLPVGGGRCARGAAGGTTSERLDEQLAEARRRDDVDEEVGGVVDAGQHVRRVVDDVMQVTTRDGVAQLATWLTDVCVMRCG